MGSVRWAAAAMHHHFDRLFGTRVVNLVTLVPPHHPATPAPPQTQTLEALPQPPT